MSKREKKQPAAEGLRDASEKNRKTLFRG